MCIKLRMSAAALEPTIPSAAALISHEILYLNERRGLDIYCAERRGLNIYMIFLYAAPRLSKLLEWAPRPSYAYSILFKRSAAAFTLSAAAFARTPLLFDLFFIQILLN